MADIDVPYYLARPKGPTRAGVVVIHEGNGMSMQLLRVCERLAAEGFAAAAPDLFFRTGGPGAVEDFMEQLRGMSPSQVLADLAVAQEALRAIGVERIGVTGFCMGGRYTWHAAVHGEGYDAAVGFYGSGIADDLGTPSCPTLLFFGGNDPWIPRPQIDAVAAHHADTTIYEQAGHGFMRDGTEDYVPDAASDAWGRLLAHFHEHLGEG